MGMWSGHLLHNIDQLSAAEGYRLAETMRTFELANMGLGNFTTMQIWKRRNENPDFAQMMQRVTRYIMKHAMRPLFLFLPAGEHPHSNIKCTTSTNSLWVEYSAKY